MNPAETAPILQTLLPDDYELSDSEINNIVFAICKFGIGWPMRLADLAVCKSMMDRDARGQRAVESLLEVTCEYLWDHVCGEPEEFSAEDLVNAMIPGLNEWYAATTAEGRAKVE